MLRPISLPSYVGQRGWLGTGLDVAVDWEEIASLILDAYREIAPSHLAAILGIQENMK